MSDDPTSDFLQSLPEIKSGEEFWFSCHPGVPCFNACCSDLTMPLTPYDVLRLCQGLAMSSEEFIEEFAIPGFYEDTGFPRLHLRMDPPPDRSCPFLTASGCGVYEHRSSACRTYPLGRATRPSADGRHTIEQFFLVREDHCKGFAEKDRWTSADWLKDQGLEPYNDMNDRFMLLINHYKERANGALLSQKLATMALLCLYQQDRFAELIASTNLFSRVTFTGRFSGQDKASIEQTIMADPQQRLLFAFDWTELVLFGTSENLTPANR